MSELSGSGQGSQCGVLSSHDMSRWLENRIVIIWYSKVAGDARAGMPYFSYAYAAARRAHVVALVVRM